MPAEMVWMSFTLCQVVRFDLSLVSRELGVVVYFSASSGSGRSWKVTITVAHRHNSVSDQSVSVAGCGIYQLTLRDRNARIRTVNLQFVFWEIRLEFLDQ